MLEGREWDNVQGKSGRKRFRIRKICILNITDETTEGMIIEESTEVASMCEVTLTYPDNVTCTY